LAGIPFARKLLRISIPENPGFANVDSPAGISSGSTHGLTKKCRPKRLFEGKTQLKLSAQEFFILFFSRIR
jgi:hypothetical protein